MNPPPQQQQDEEQEEDYLVYIVCDCCGKCNPRKCCSRCQCQYYCSVDCQRRHWKQEHRDECIPVDEALRRSYTIVKQDDDDNDDEAFNKMLQKLRTTKTTKHNNNKNDKRKSATTNNTTTPTVGSVNAACGICLRYPMQQPIVLLEEQCRHGFCLPCLQDLRQCRRLEIPCQVHLETGDNIPLKTKACPICRLSDPPVYRLQAIIEKTEVLFVKSRRLLDEAERQQYLTLALEEIDKIRENDRGYLVALYLKSHILKDVQPQESIRTVKKLLQLDKERFKTESMLMEIETAMITRSGKDAQLIQAFQAKYPNSMISPPPLSNIGRGPDRLFPIQILLAEAYEAAHMWDEAQYEYFNILDETARYGLFFQPNWATTQLCLLYTGIARCLHQMGLYVEAIKAGTKALESNRQYRGVHKAVAMPQQALLLQQQSGVPLSKKRISTLTCNENGVTGPYAADIFGNDTRMSTSRTKSTTTNPIHIMQQSMVYEAPWDAAHLQTNADYLQELVRLSAENKVTTQTGNNP